MENELYIAYNDKKPCAIMLKNGMDYTISIYGSPDFSELAWFIKSMGGGMVTAERPVCIALQPYLGGQLGHSKILRYEGRDILLNVPGSAVQVEPVRRLEEVYRLLCECHSGFERRTCFSGWYCEMSHQIRHGLAEFCGVYHDGKLVSTGGITAKNGAVALLSSFATRPDSRSNGYCTAIVRTLTAHALSEGFSSMLCSKTDSLAEFYQTMGYRICAEWGDLRI